MNKLSSKLKIILPPIVIILFTASLAHADWHLPVPPAKKSDADFQKGLTAYKNKDYAIAIAEWEPIAQKGYGGAAYKLGKIYQLGQGVPQDYGKAIKWFERAGKGRYGAKKKFWRGAAFYTLGLMHLKGEGVPKNQKKAYSMFLKSVQKGAGTWQGLASYNMGLMALKGEGVRKSQRDAIYWFKRSARSGNKEAKKALKEARNKAANERKRKKQQITSSCSWSKREIYHHTFKKCYVPRECQGGKRNTLTCLEIGCISVPYKGGQNTRCRNKARELVNGCKVVVHSKVGESKCMEGTPRKYVFQGTGACAGPIPGPDCPKPIKLSGKPIPLQSRNFKNILNNNVLETYRSFFYFLNDGAVFRARKAYFGSVRSPESYGFFYERGRFFWGKKTRTMGRKPFEGVCIKWQKRKKEKKGRQECYAMQMTPKEVLMDQWHGRKQKYVVAKRRDIKYLRRKGRFPIKLRNE